MFGIGKIHNSNVPNIKNSKVWYRQKFTHPMPGKAKKKRIPMFGEAKTNKKFQRFELAKFTILMFGKAKNKVFQCLEYAKLIIPMFGRAKNEQL